MFRKINIRTLLYIFGALLAVVIISQVMEKRKGERTFRSELAAFDTARVTSVIISDPKNGNSALELVRTGRAWTMKSNGREYRTDKDNINNLLMDLTGLKAERIAATGKEKWKEFEVTDSLALRATVKGKNKILADLMVGRFSWQPSNNPYDRQGIMTTYVRIADEKEVYAVNGFLRMSLSPDVNRFRDKTLVKSVPGQLKKLTFQYPADSSFILEKQGNTWIIQGQPADSAKTSLYLASLEDLSGADISDDASVEGQPIFRLTLESSSAAPVEVQAFVADSLNGHIITSSLNPDTKFSGRNGLTEKIFKNRFAFINPPAER